MTPTGAPDAAIRLRDAKAELDSLLLVGGDTSVVRSVIASVEAELAVQADAAAAERAVVEDQERAAIAARAYEIAAAAGARATAVLGGLEPPASPI